MTARKATIVGIQQGNTAEQRQASGRPTPGGPPSGGAGRPSAPEAPSARGVVMTPPDGMKTIARPSPGFLAANRPVPSRAPAPAQPAAPAGAFGSRPPGTRPAPSLPSKLAPPRAGGVPSASAPPSFATKPVAAGSARSGLAQTFPSAPQAQPQSSAPVNYGGARSLGGGVESAPDEIDIEIDAGRSASDAIEITADGMADAEAALEAMQSFRSAEAALQRNDLASAQKLAQKAVSGDPTQTDYLTLLAWVQALGGGGAAVGEAITTMSNVLGEDPSNERALLYRGKLLARSNRLQEALADFNELLSGNPQNREAQAEMRAVRAKIG